MNEWWIVCGECRPWMPEQIHYSLELHMDEDRHYRALERMYLAAPFNRIFQPSISVSKRSLFGSFSTIKSLNHCSMLRKLYMARFTSNWWMMLHFSQPVQLNEITSCWRPLSKQDSQDQYHQAVCDRSAVSSRSIENMSLLRRLCMMGMVWRLAKVAGYLCEENDLCLRYRPTVKHTMKRIEYILADWSGSDEKYGFW